MGRMSTRQLMVAGALVAIVCGAISGFAGMGSSQWELMSVVATMVGIYLALSFAFGFLINVIAPVGGAYDDRSDATMLRGRQGTKAGGGPRANVLYDPDLDA